MFRTRERAGRDGVPIRGHRTLHLASNITESSGERWNPFGEPDHVGNYEDLSVGVGASSNADCGYLQVVGDCSTEVGGHMLEQERERPGLLVGQR